MDRWLVTFPASVPPDRRAEIVEAAGARTRPQDSPVPLGEEVAVRVEADRKAVAELRSRAEVTGVFPDSEMTPY